MATAKAKQGQHFVKEVLAQLQGDQDKVIAERNARKAISAVKGQLSALEGELIRVEEQAELADEKLHKAIYPVTAINDFGVYTTQVSLAKNEVLIVQGELESVQDSVKFFTELQDTFLK